MPKVGAEAAEFTDAPPAAPFVAGAPSVGAGTEVTICAEAETAAMDHARARNVFEGRKLMYLIIAIINVATWNAPGP